MNETCLRNAGLTEVKTNGTTPAEAAITILAKEWARLDDATIRHLAETGLAKLISDDLAKNRGGRDMGCGMMFNELSAKEQNAYRQEVDRIHDLIGCFFTSHNNFRKKEKCVRYLINLPTKEKNEGIKKRIAENKVSARELQESESKSFQKLYRVISKGVDDVYRSALDDLQSIMLISSDGSMKSLFDFNVDDASKWIRESTSRIKSWKSRQEFFRSVRSCLQDSSVDVVSKLSVDDIKMLAEKARQVWNKEEDE